MHKSLEAIDLLHDEEINTINYQQFFEKYLDCKLDEQDPVQHVLALSGVNLDDKSVETKQ